MLNGITIVGSIVGTRNELREVFELHAAGRTRVIREERPLAEVNEAIEEVEAGRVPARVVLRALTLAADDTRPRGPQLRPSRVCRPREPSAGASAISRNEVPRAHRWRRTAAARW